MTSPVEVADGPCGFKKVVDEPMLLPCFESFPLVVVFFQGNTGRGRSPSDFRFPADEHNPHRLAPYAYAMVAQRATFRKQERLTGRDAINAVLKQGVALHEKPFRVVGRFGSLDSTAPAQVAFAIPKRHVKKASDRNHLRRLMREAYRMEKERWYGPLRAAGVQCAWLLVYQASHPLAFNEVRERLCGLLDRWLVEQLPKVKTPQA